MTRDPVLDPRDPWGLESADIRLAALLPQLEAADALASAVAEGRSRRVIEAAMYRYLAARDAHLTEGTGDG